MRGGPQSPEQWPANPPYDPTDFKEPAAPELPPEYQGGAGGYEGGTQSPDYNPPASEYNNEGAGGAGGMARGGGFEGGPQSPEQWPANPPYDPTDFRAPELPPNYTYRVVDAWGIVGLCSCTWRAVFSPETYDPGTAMHHSDPNYQLPVPKPPDIIGGGSIVGDRCLPRTIEDENGNPYSSPPVPFKNLTVDTASGYRNQGTSTDNPYPRGPYE